MTGLINLIYKDECLYVCLFVPYINPHFWTDRNQTLHTAAPWPGRDCRVCIGPKFLTSSTFWSLLGAAHGHKMAAVVTVFRDTLISVVPAGVRVTSPTLCCRWWRSHPQQSYIRDSSRSYPYVLADDRVIRYSVLSLILVGVRVTSWILRSTGQRAHPSQRYIPHSSSCFCGLQEIMSLQTTVVRSYSKCVALSVMRTIRWDMNGIHVSTIPNLIRREGSD
jgi:hypothetical protein